MGEVGRCIHFRIGLSLGYAWPEVRGFASHLWLRTAKAALTIG